MTREPVGAALVGGVSLLERAITYTLGTLHAVTPEELSRPTPCRDWDLRALLHHLDDSLTVLLEAVDARYVDLDPPAGGPQPPAGGPLPPACPVAAVRSRASRLLGAWANAEDGPVSIGGCPVTAAIVTSTGAIEVAVHGWDVGRACGLDRPIPPGLGVELLELCPLFVTEASRPRQFDPPVDVPASASPGDRLVAFLGRDPVRPIRLAGPGPRRP
jgi:uncharacterized protein (TIGR03086 family)